MQKLNLINALTFKRERTTFNSLMLKMLMAPRGSDGFILYSFSYSDGGISLKQVDSGFKTPLTDKEIERINSGLSPIVRSDEDTSIPAGKYYFEQYPDLSEEALLEKTLASISSAKGGEKLIYVRLYKENELECVMQAFRPCPK